MFHGNMLWLNGLWQWLQIVLLFIVPCCLVFFVCGTCVFFWWWCDVRRVTCAVCLCATASGHGGTGSRLCRTAPTHGRARARTAVGPPLGLGAWSRLQPRLHSPLHFPQTPLPHSRLSSPLRSPCSFACLLFLFGTFLSLLVLVPFWNIRRLYLFFPPCKKWGKDSETFGSPF